MNSISTPDYSLAPALPTATPAQLSVHFMGRTLTIRAEQITFLEGDGNYTYVYTCAGRKYLICKTLKWLARKLDHNFVRVHKSFIVNADYVIGCAEDGRALKMQCGNEAAVSRRKTKEIISIFGERVERISA